ncbi:hypothetical protein AAVH_11716 [Aphelenchoides avenae]|nr:hypothetical protein AAVH_11716 [Aphelenchus avenae]
MTANSSSSFSTFQLPQLTPRTPPMAAEAVTRLRHVAEALLRGRHAITQSHAAVEKLLQDAGQLAYDRSLMIAEMFDMVAGLKKDIEQHREAKPKAGEELGSGFDHAKTLAAPEELQRALLNRLEDLEEKSDTVQQAYRKALKKAIAYVRNFDIDDMEQDLGRYREMLRTAAAAIEFDTKPSTALLNALLSLPKIASPDTESQHVEHIKAVEELRVHGYKLVDKLCAMENKVSTADDSLSANETETHFTATPSHSETSSI